MPRRASTIHPLDWITIGFAVCILSLFAVASLATANEANKTGTLEVVVTNLESDEGYLVIAVLNSAAQYDAGDEMFRSNAKVPIKNGTARITFEGLPFGSYAVKTFHDENANGELDTNFVGFPKEGFGFSNNAMGKFGPPSFEQTRFEFASESLRIEIKSS
ncbi:MAG: DUF2141 domain-containing protein [Myxococcota bacterium]|jgi:uncharacterized protein (DUF2141 family)|nr:DUF2141 domain-containing protein [Myxococcota bacterium]